MAQAFDTSGSQHMHTKVVNVEPLWHDTSRYTIILYGKGAAADEHRIHLISLLGSSVLASGLVPGVRIAGYLYRQAGARTVRRCRCPNAPRGQACDASMQSEDGVVSRQNFCPDLSGC
ncbi:hypothetical protein TgHK011_006853 [Trichoderma gracile]|nr:hypothetical protein TgHK011_006853 [Trichoderma gracile]